MNYWDRIAGVYDLFERIYNGMCYDSTGERVMKYIKEGGKVLECACGTGSISVWLAKKAGRLTATDMSDSMLRQAAKNLSRFDNFRLCKANIYELRAKDNSFDNVVAGNVIHLLDEPYRAVNEMLRVCKPGGKVIIPTYINAYKKSSKLAVKAIELTGVHFSHWFDRENYKQFFADGGYRNVVYELVDGRMPCMIAVITKE